VFVRSSSWVVRFLFAADGECFSALDFRFVLPAICRAIIVHYTLREARRILEEMFGSSGTLPFGADSAEISSERAKELPCRL
jgi:hypothetical protein